MPLFNDVSDLGAASTENRPRAVVIGAGTVGLFLGALLVERGWKVVVVESGNIALGGFSSQAYSSIGKPHRGIVNGRSRSLGGSSNLWGGQLVEFQPIDFERRLTAQVDGWPIPFSELQPYFAKTFLRLGIPTGIHDDDTVLAAAMGERPHFADGVELFLTRWMKTPSIAALYAREIESDPSLKVLLGHTATGFRYEGTDVTAVLARNDRGETVDLEGDCYVMAAGTVETVRLLLAAAHDDSCHCPWHHNRMLGLRFQDHLGGRIGAVLPFDRQRLFACFSTIYWKGFKFQPKLRLSEAVLREEGLLGMQAIMSFESSVSEHLVYLKQFLKAAIYSRKVTGIASFFKHLIGCVRHLPPLMWTYLKDHRVYVPFDSRISLNVQAEQRPTDRSRITLDPLTRDECGLPRVVLDWQLDGSELPSIQALAVRCDRALRDAGLGEVRIANDLTAGKPEFLDSLSDTYHAAGGAVMAIDESHGVVDPNLRVFGTSNLFVSSPAVLPTSSSANVTFTTLALATRLADHLQRWVQ